VNSGNCGVSTFSEATVGADGTTVTVSPGEEKTVGTWTVAATFEHYDSHGTTCPVAYTPEVTFHASRP
jgi:hypothetical protein